MAKKTYIEAVHAMQSGAAAMIGIASSDTEPKHLRVGINIALRDHASLFELLIKKNIITEEEYLEAVTDGMNKEVEGYEKKLSEKTGSIIKLG